MPRSKSPEVANLSTRRWRNLLAKRPVLTVLADQHAIFDARDGERGYNEIHAVLVKELDALDGRQTQAPVAKGGLVNRWLVEDSREPGLSIMFDGPDGEKAAREYQEALARKGHACQLYHEAHVLMKVPVRWLAAGEGFVTESPKDPTDKGIF